MAIDLLDHYPAWHTKRRSQRPDRECDRQRAGDAFGGRLEPQVVRGDGAEVADVMKAR